MTVEEYYAAIARLGLKQTNVPGVFADRSGEFYNVPDPRQKTPEQREEIVAMITRLVRGEDL